jgi:flavin-dependent dehydrogenase
MRLAYEVVVVGGGPGGAATALVLARLGQRVLLVERMRSDGFKIGESLPPVANALLREFDVWERFVSDGHLRCYATVSAWGAPRLQAVDFIFDPHGHGWHLDRRHFDASLRQAARAAGATVCEATALIRSMPRPGNGGWHLRLHSPEQCTEVKCSWVVDATGRRSWIARAQGSHRLAYDALYSAYTVFAPAHRGLACDHDARTLIEAEQDGWWYTALLPSKQRVVAYLTDWDTGVLRALYTPGTFLARLGQTQHLRACLETHDYRLKAKPRGAAANSARLDRFVGAGWLAVGDAALSFDPLSSQGIFTALYTGMKAGQALHASFHGDQSALHAYSQQLEMIYTTYLRNRDNYYQLERRWMQRPFWKRRHADGQAAALS